MAEERYYQEIAVKVTSAPECLLIFLRSDDLRSPLTIKTLSQDLINVMKLDYQPRIVIDFARVRYAPSAVLGQVMRLLTDADRRGAAVRISSPHPSVRKALEFIGAAPLVQFYDNTDAAFEDDWDTVSAGPKKARPKRKRSWWPFGR